MSKEMVLAAKSRDVLKLSYYPGFGRTNKYRIYTIGNSDALPLHALGQRVLIDTADRFPTPPGVFALFNGTDHGLYRIETLHKHWPPACWLSRLSRPAEHQVIALAKLKILGRMAAD
jgi:hypothetical protein